MSRKPQDQDEAIVQAFIAGTLPDEDRRAAEARGVEFPSTPDRGPFQARTADEIARGVPHTPSVIDTRTPEQIAAGVPIDTRTVAQVAAGVPAPVDELERLLRLAEDETGYAQKQAITDLRKLLGRPKGSQRDVQVLAGQAQKAAADEIHDKFGRGEVTATARDAALEDVSKRQESVLIADHIARTETPAVVVSTTIET